ncbi:MAG: hypothetical protein AAGE59_11985 [Cyanobacteria bacterium P01_F01_bin.86]
MTVLAKLQVSKKLLRFTPSDRGDFSRAEPTVEPGLREDEFDVTVVNTTNCFASFQVELETEKKAPGQTGRWYEVEPEVGAKQPPGDRTTFHVTLLKAPIPAYDTRLTLTVNAFSVEVNDIESNETVQVQIGRPKKSLHAHLPFQEMTVYPGNRIKIPALIYNLSAEFVRITLRLRGVDPSWIQGGQDRIVQIESGGFTEELFWCHPPPSAKSRHQTYNLVLEAVDSHSNTASDVAHLQVLPFGQVQVACDRPQQAIAPLQPQSVTYPLNFRSESNTPHRILLTTNTVADVTLMLPKETILQPEQTTTLDLVATAKPPWIGRRCRHLIEVVSTLYNPETGDESDQKATQPASQLLSLDVLPVLPLWFQLSSSIVFLLLIALFSWLNPPRSHHTSDINSIRLIANEETVVSASSDQTIRRWQVDERSWVPAVRRLRHKGTLATGTQGIRVVRQLPAEVAQVAAGLENGDIQFWPISPATNTPIAEIPGNNDRVFDLVFTEDSKYLFSVHGSGRVRQWIQTSPNIWKPGVTFRPDHTGALSAIAISETLGKSTLVVLAGQYNRLILWDWQLQQAYQINYMLSDSMSSAFPAVVSQNSYVTDIAIAQQPNQPDSSLLATADNQGFITLWDLEVLRSCITNAPKAQNSLIAVTCDRAQLDQWQENSQGLAVRSVSLTTDACHLASTGDSGRIRLWPLLPSGRRDPEMPTKQTILDRFPDVRLNSVNLQKSSRNTLLVASDTPGYRVRLYRQQVKSDGCQ